MTSETPQTTTPSKVARHATQTVTLEQTALLGVFGAEKDLQALVRLPYGNTRTVTLGDRLIGGTVVAIGSDQLVVAHPDGRQIMHLPRS